MKTLKFQPSVFIMLALIALMQFSCSEISNLEPNNNSDFDIFLTKNPIRYNSMIDYSEINLDTIDLNDEPFLTFDDIESYDTINYIINLKKSKSNFDFPSSGIFGQMFVVTVNKTPVYCGFFWSIMSSVPCNWIYIEDANELNGLTDNQIQISAGYPSSSYFRSIDPRNDSIILDFFSKKELLTGNTKAIGNGLNFYLVNTSKHDTSKMRLDNPVDMLNLETEPFISYEEILSYDTTNQIMELSINHDIIKSRIKNYGKPFVASLDDKKQYSGFLVPITSSAVYPTITIIQPYYGLDKLQPTQIKISLGYPSEQYFIGDDLRLSDIIVERLKQDNKIK